MTAPERHRMLAEVCQLYFPGVTPCALRWMIKRRGYALAAGKRMVVIGPRENIFCWLPHVEHHATWQDFLACAIGAR